MRKCECPEFRSGLPCGGHLNRTCEAMYEAENPRKPALTVTAVTS